MINWKMGHAVIGIEKCAFCSPFRDAGLVYQLPYSKKVFVWAEGKGEFFPFTS